MRRALPLVLALGSLACLVAAQGCSSDPATVTNPGGGGNDAGATADGAGGDGGSSGDSGSGDGAPIDAPANTWTFVDFPDSACDDGTKTGIGVYPNPSSDKLLVFFNGGGACWDYFTCVELNTSTHGPFGQAQFTAASRSGFAGSVMDHKSAENPFKDYNTVFIPYCTGDVHTGDTVNTYANGGKSKQIHHKGHANVTAYLKRLVATFKKPSQVMVTGSSAGGGGALFNYPTFRAAWPDTNMMLVDDSLPLFIGNSINPGLRGAWFDSWKLDAVAGPICGAACKDDLSLFPKAVAQKYPKDRMALLSSQQDQTIRTYFQLQPADFQAALEKLNADVLTPLPNYRHFVVPGASHTMLGDPAKYTAGGVGLFTWLGQMSSGDAAWASVAP
ncbi:MAG: esterase [Myxococcales bacterium]|nr:esterase [Myxococcales bacterium]